MSKHHVIYIPGIGDYRPWGQDKLIQIWRLFGITPHYHPVIWDKVEPFEVKLKKLSDQVEYLTNQGFMVSVVGASAGTSAALNLYMANNNKIHRAVYVCGKIKFPEPVNPKYYHQNPAFKTSLQMSNAALSSLARIDKIKMLYMHALRDTTVPPKINKPKGIKTKRILAIGHIPAIYVGITFYAYSISKFIRND